MKKLINGMICSFLLIFLAQCVTPSPPVSHPPGKEKSPPPWAPAHGKRAKHRYYYYPSVYVYFDIDRKVYFYLEKGVWRVAAKLPPIILPPSPGEVIEIILDTDKPYVYFDDHKKKYPPKKWKKKKKKATDKWKNKY